MAQLLVRIQDNSRSVDAMAVALGQSKAATVATALNAMWSVVMLGKTIDRDTLQKCIAEGGRVNTNPFLCPECGCNVTEGER